MHLDWLVKDDPEAGAFLVHRSALTSPELFELERERVFGHCWLYVGHDSEVPQPGDYRRRVVAGRPLFFTRGRDGAVRVFYNSCTHRGATLCRQDEGNAQSFQCFYHAWTFNNHGELISTPDAAGYAADFDKRNYALKSPPRLENHRGLYFVSFDRDIVDLRSYLGDACELIDLTMDSAEVLGGWTVLRGSARYSIKANWKLLVENSVDGYHFQTVHQTYLEYIAWRTALTGKNDEASTHTPRGIALPHGHGGMLHRSAARPIASPSARWSDEANRIVTKLRNALIARFGEERGSDMCDITRHIIIFPNLAFQDSGTGFRLRLIWPVAPDLMDVTQWDLVPRDESEERRASRIEGSLAFLGPGGLATPDDIEALESCQRGFAADGVEWSDVSRGMHRQPLAMDEQQMRSFWRQWHSLMLGQGLRADTADRQQRVQALAAR